MAFEYIQDLKLPLGRLTRRSVTRRVLVHHFAGNSSVPDVNAYHRRLGHQGIDYNIVIQRDGSVVWGRGLDYAGGSVNNSNPKTKGYNSTSVAVALQGNCENEPLSDAQWHALVRVVRDLVDYYNLPLVAASILGHDEAAGPGYTVCPGRYVDMDALRAAVFQADAAPVPPPTVGPPSTAIPHLTPNAYRGHIVKLASPYMRGDHEKLAQYNLFRHHADCGGIDGIWGPKSDAAAKAFQAARISEGRDCGCPIGPDGKQTPDGKIGPKTAAILAE